VPIRHPLSQIEAKLQFRVKQASEGANYSVKHRFRIPPKPQRGREKQTEHVYSSSHPWPINHFRCSCNLLSHPALIQPIDRSLCATLLITHISLFDPCRTMRMMHTPLRQCCLDLYSAASILGCAICAMCEYDRLPRLLEVVLAILPLWGLPLLTRLGEMTIAALTDQGRSLYKALT
jgi:hypothetical protein